ncbi:MAG TPA: hypothetical protein VER11_29780 [Polyangiaceae bacterium]|nr:hypothetical protein [Polyangiaceae bacterium]
MTKSVYQSSVTAVLLKAAQGVLSYARQVELRDPAVSKPFYAASCWLKTAAAIGGAL